MGDPNFPETKGTKLSTKQTKKILKIINRDNKVKYQNTSHFIRVAVDNLIKEELK